MAGTIRALWNAPAATPAPPRRVWRDWVLLGVFVPLPLIEAVLRPELPWVVLWSLATAAVAPTLLFRRTHPLAMFATAFLVLGVVSVIAGGSTELFSSAYILLLPYSVVRWGSARAGVVAAALMITSLGATALLQRSPLADTVGGLAVTVSLVAIGLALRFRASARLRERDRIVLMERESLARDLHDTVAHHVSAIAIRAQAGLATSTNDPAAAIDALQVIELEASRTLTEMRTIVRALRTAGDEAERSPSPTLAELTQLTNDPAGALRADIAIRGDTDRLEPTIVAAIYRIAREAITNSRRHSRGASSITVDLVAHPDRVRLEVRDDGQGAAPSSPGFGLIGMVERATLLGGTCTAGPGPEGGWLVTAELPRQVRAA